jgi:Ras-related GTP-binding protein C/D
VEKYQVFLTAEKMRGKVLITGLSSAGKSSIQQVVFQRTAEDKSQDRVVFEHPFLKLEFIDFSTSQLDEYFSNQQSQLDSFLKDVFSIVFVIDAQDDYMDALSKLFLTLTLAHRQKPQLQCSIFIHKCDALTEDAKIGTLRDVQTRINDELSDAGLENMILSFYTTSIYDYSVYESLSKVIQRLLSPSPLALFENLLNALCAHSNIEKAYLFDTMTKLYLATDSSPVEMAGYELACDMLDMVLDIRFIYGNTLHSLHHSQTHDQDQTTTPDIVKESENDHCETSIQLNNGLVLHMRHLSPQLALVCYLRGEHLREKRGWMSLNLSEFARGWHQLTTQLQK